MRINLKLYVRTFTTSISIQSMFQHSIRNLGVTFEMTDNKPTFETEAFTTCIHICLSWLSELRRSGTVSYMRESHHISRCLCTFTDAKRLCTTPSYASACLEHSLLQPSYKSNVCDSPRAFYESDIRCWEKPDTAPCKANEYFLRITEERFGTSWKWKSERKLQCGAIFAAVLQLIPRKKQEANDSEPGTATSVWVLSHLIQAEVNTV